MDFLTALLQMFSAFAIFVAGYLALMFSVILCFVLATCIYKGGCLARAYTVRSGSLDHCAISDDASDAGLPSRYTLHRRRGVHT
jgi:hypothetical protein